MRGAVGDARERLASSTAETRERLASRAADAQARAMDKAADAQDGFLAATTDLESTIERNPLIAVRSLCSSACSWGRSADGANESLPRSV